MTQDFTPSKIGKHSFLLSVLKHSSKGSAKISEVVQESRLSLEDSALITRNLMEEGVSIEKDGEIAVEPTGRLRIAFELVKSGSDIERVFKYLSWQEFEEASAQILEECGYKVYRRIRFRNEERRFEIDLLGFRNPLILCLDCKHWMRGSQRSPLRKAIEEQVKRVKSLPPFLKSNKERFHLKTWRKAKLLPVMIALLDVPLQPYNGVPTVPVLRLGNFLYELSLAIDTLNSTNVDLSS